MTFDAANTPREVKRVDDDHIAIIWDDGESCTYAMNLLRSRCPCASCVDEWTREVLIQFEDVKDVRVKCIRPVGTYALNIAFDDGHDTGFFTFQALRDLCGALPPND